MSGDFGPRITIPAALQSLQDNPHLAITLVGDEQRLQSDIAESKYAGSSRLQIQSAETVLLPDSKPSEALRVKRQSSLGEAVGMLQDKRVDACVSAANAGAMMALGRSMLGVLPEIERPAICAALPTRDGVAYMLDLGANVDCSAEQLYQFAVLGSVMVEVSQNKPFPRVALLNIGSELIKGNRQVLAAAELLKSCDQLNYVGYVEADQLFETDADVIVADGFAGNIALKTAEGTARFVASGLRELFSAGLMSRFIGFLARPSLQRWFDHYNPARLNGASLLGLPEVVIKSHGGADSDAFRAAIELAYQQVNTGLAAAMTKRFQRV